MTALEKMAKAMAQAAFTEFDRNTGGVKLASDGVSAEVYDGTAMDFVEIARAGLEAIREPGDAGQLFQSVIDAILKEPSKP